jgi:hypothetical protein
MRGRASLSCLIAPTPDLAEMGSPPRNPTPIHLDWRKSFEVWSSDLKHDLDTF